MVLVPVKVVETLEQRIIFLEETVAALTESWQHIDTHRLCVSDDSAETCITKSQLDVLLARLAQAAAGQPEASQQASVSATDAPAQPVDIAAASPQPSTVVEENSLRDQDSLRGQDSDVTGVVNPAITDAAVLSYPKVEVYEDPEVRTDE
jgi:hypothetical protein